MSKKIHLGCGNLYLDEYINIDIDINSKADINIDITNLSIFKKNNIEEIYICHVLEHIKRNKIINFILELNRVLKINGTLRISVPDFKKIVYIYSNNNKLYNLNGLLNGGQKDEYDNHLSTYDFAILSEILNICGFDNIKEYDCNTFLNEDQDDYSKSYIPHMDKNGVLMSLNIICIKTQDIDINNIVLNNNIKQYCKL